MSDYEFTPVLADLIWDRPSFGDALRTATSHLGRPRGRSLQSLLFLGAWPNSQPSSQSCWTVAATSPPKRLARAVR
jgi:hypothetical protein